MIKRIGTAALVSFAVSVAAFSARAVDLTSWSVGTQAGTMGVGLTVGYEFSEALAVRGVVNPGLNVGLDMEEAGIDYDGSLKLRSFGALLDWRPFPIGFRLTGGVFLNRNRLSAKASDPKLKLGDLQYDADLNAHVTISDIGPYLGIGWIGGLGGSGLTLFADLGAIYQGAPELSGSGRVRVNNTQCDFSVANSGAATVVGDKCPTTLKLDLEQEHAELSGKLDKFKWYPVVSFGISYRF